MFRDVLLPRLHQVCEQKKEFQNIGPSSPQIKPSGESRVKKYMLKEAGDSETNQIFADTFGSYCEGGKLCRGKTSFHGGTFSNSALAT